MGITMSRNQKATTLASAFYVLAFAFFLWGAMVSQETRVSGTIRKRQIDIPVYLQNEPEYVGLKNTKVYPGWGGGRLLLWGVLGLGSALTGLVLSNERRAELAKERIKYKVECHELDQQARLDAAYRVSLDKQMKERTGEAALTVLEDKLEAEVDANREINGWYAPEKPEPPRQLPAPQLRNEPIAPPPNSPEALKAELEALAAAAREKFNKPENECDRPDSDRTMSNTADTRYKLYQDRGQKIMRSLAALKMSILSAAPTGAGKTHTLYRWLGDLQALYPQNEVYVIAHKRDSFLGLLEQGRVDLFNDLNPEISLRYLDKVYAQMCERLNEPESDRAKFKNLPIRLILDDWFASYGVLKLDPALWNQVKVKIGAIITKGREANVCLYIATQSFNLEAIGLQDSNIRGNLAITCQGLVTEVLDEYGELVEQGNYETLQLIIGNKFIVSSREDRERLNAELEELVALSRLHQVPAMFSAVGKNTLGLAPYYEKPIAGEDSAATNVAILDRNVDELTPDELREKAMRWELEWNLRDSPNHSSLFPSSAQNDDSTRVSESDEPSDTESDEENGEVVGNSNWETNNWYKWLPSKAEVLKLLEETDANYYTLAYIVRSKLKKTDAEYNRKAKSAIVQMILDLDRIDLIEKYQINPKDYPLS
jgi:hypothetical protein